MNSILLITMRKAGIFVLLVDCPKTTRVVSNIEEFRIKTCDQQHTREERSLHCCSQNIYLLFPKAVHSTGDLLKIQALPNFPNSGLDATHWQQLSRVSVSKLDSLANHSGKVTCATSLFRSGVDEQLIKKQTSHRSDSV